MNGSRRGNSAFRAHVVGKRAENKDRAGPFNAGIRRCRCGSEKNVDFCKKCYVLSPRARTNNF